ncbi:SoxR reducing system RseC family protein [Thalassomonas sp. M1454]|uniref:SoxR reducing system RseC family protein n=1 Tax=Thalassomonas sp. M1454 TaxID=2594477 RepID=UPI00117DE4BA|nr:SoxR reducing system RseC family protein [Thalassomonas sp. M1454]TRX54531.1 SoxR reducing system RseC family protein [Thalassomonas sp. M1454]
MIEEVATVTAIDGDIITVKSTIKSTCHSCHQQDDCGSGQIAKAIPHKALTTKLTTSLQLNVGDEVVLGLPENSMLTSAFEVYMLPLFGLVLFAAFGQFTLVESYELHELFALFFAVIGALLGFYLAKYRQSNTQVAANLQPKIMRKCANTIPVKQI